MRSHFSIFLVIVITAGLAGCGSGTPRFSQRDKDKTVQRDTPRFSRELQIAAREERREDDVKVDVTEARSRIVLPTNRESRILREALRHIGTPYVYGGTGAGGIDCSAFTRTVFNNSMNIALPRTTVEQYRVGQPVRMPERRFGDLVFFNTTGRNPSHVGIYLGDNLFAHASVSNGVTISSLESTYFQRRITGVRRVLN